MDADGERNVELPQKKFFRQRAHSNPMSDHDLVYPLSPDLYVVFACQKFFSFVEYCLNFVSAGSAYFSEEFQNGLVALLWNISRKKPNQFS